MELSIVIPVWNAERTLARTLQSLERIASERRGDVEVILIDDGSTDGSAALLSDYAADAPFSNVQVITKENGGSASARNAGLAVAGGTWVYFLDADDEIACDLMAEIPTNAATTAVACSIELHRDGERYGTRRPQRVTPKRHLALLTAGNPNFSQAMLVRRSAIEVPFDDKVLTLEDWVFWMMNPRVFASMELRPSVTIAIIHAHGANKSSRYAWRGRERSRIALSMLERLADQLTKATRNNLMIQEAIGHLQGGESAGWRVLTRVPCSAVLYSKLWVYFVLRSRFAKVDFYGR